MLVDKNKNTENQYISITDWLKILIVYCFIPAVLFISAGDMTWINAWIYSFILIIISIGGRIWAERNHPGVLKERVSSLKLKKNNIKTWDKILAPLMAFCFAFPLPIIAGLDHRCEWSPAFPNWVIIIGFILIIIGYMFAIWAFRENKFFSSIVRIQAERGHSVCDTGPYKIVRHPGYAGNIFALFGIILALNSLWAIIPTLFALIITIIRTNKEDQVLKGELSGYTDYTLHVRYKLLPRLY